MSAQRVAGAILLLVGVVLLVFTVTDADGSWLLPIVGGAFLVGFAVTRSYGLLVPGGIVTGLGIGVVLVETQGMPQGVVPLGLGVGFLAIAVVHLLTGGGKTGWWWWPLIPGGIITTVGATALSDVDVAAFVVPGVLIVIGLALILGGVGRRKRDEPADD